MAFSVPVPTWEFLHRAKYPLLLAPVNAIMIVLVIFSGIEYPAYQYAFALWLCVVSGVGFTLAHFCAHGRSMSRAAALAQVRGNVKVHAALGLAWAFNYVFLLVANPYVPGTVQVVFNELNVVVVVVVTLGLNRTVYRTDPHKVTYDWVLLVCCVGVIGSGLLTLVNPTSTAAPTSIPRWIWNVVYIVGSGAIAIANIISEKVFKASKGAASGDLSIGLCFAMANVWCFLFCALFFVVPYLAVLDLGTFWSNTTTGLHDIITFANWRGSLWSLLAAAISVPGSYFSVVICRDDPKGATFNSLVLAVAPGVSAIILNWKALIGETYYQPITGADIASIVLVLAFVLAFKGWQAYRQQTHDCAEGDGLLQGHA
jgi:hypothetical protein